MPVYKDENGKYFVTFRKKDPITGKITQTRKRGFSTKRDALKWESENKYVESSKTSATFWDLFQKYLDNNDTSADTRKKKESWIKKYFPFRDDPIDKITKGQLIEWRNELKEAGISTRTANNGLQYVRSVFGFYNAVYGGQNVASIIRPFKLSKNDKQEMKVWSVAEFNQFVEHVENPVMKAYFSFLFWTGCRRGEAIALTADCFDGNKVHFYRSMKHFKSGFRPLKTDSSERTIRLDHELMKMITPLIAEADPFVFGKVFPLAITTIDTAFRKGIEASGVKPIRIHDLRHSHASILLNNGVNIVAVSKRLGHATVSQTLETYTHLMRETDDRMMETIDNLKKK